MITSFESLTPQQKWQCEINYQSRKIVFDRWKTTGFVNSDKTILIVGDRPGPKAISDTPFFGKSHSGGWLNTNLVANNISEFKLFWINAASQSGNPSDSYILQSRKWISIALGKNAEAWLSDNGQCYTAFEHPQFHRRFKGRKEYPFIEYLKVMT